MTPLEHRPQETQTKKLNCKKLQKQSLSPQTYNWEPSLVQISSPQVPSWLPPHKQRHKPRTCLRDLQIPQWEKQLQGDQDLQEEGEDKACQTHWPTLLGPLEEEIRVAAGGILEEEGVTQVVEILEEEGVTQVAEILEEEAEIQPLPTTNFQGNSPLFSKEIAKNPKRLYRNGTYIEALTISPHK